MNDRVFYSKVQLKGNVHRTLKANLLTYLPEEILDNLTNKYFRDKEGNLLCAYTGKVIDNESNQLELEHIIPLSNGGGTILFNVVPSLKEVNGSGEKSNNNLLDWWKKSKYYDISRLESIVNYMLDGYEYCAKQDGVFASELEETTEQEDDIEGEEYFDEMQKDVEEKVIIKKHDINIYKTFLNSLIIELENNKINVSSYIERIKNLEKENVFEELDEQVMYQKVMLSLMRKYANNEKYKISSEVDYKKIIHNLGLDNIKDNFEVKLENFVMTLNEEKKVPVNVHKSNEKLVNEIDKNIDSFIDKSNKLLDKIKSNKKVKDEDILRYELEKQIIKIFKKTSNKISFNLMMEYIIEYPEILYDDNFNFDKLIKEHYKKYDKYADLIIGFCNLYRKFPSQSGTNEYQGKREKTIYNYYNYYKDKFSKEKRDKIERLKNLFESEKYNKYADIIIGFCNEYQKFPSDRGTKDYHGINEATIYGYYNSHKDKFSKEKRDEIEKLKKLYPNKRGIQTLSQAEIDNYADIIIGFCNEYKRFPSQNGTKEYHGINEKTLYNYYSSHKDKFFKEKRDEIERLKDLYQDGSSKEKTKAEIDNYADIIIGFCNEYQKFPKGRGTKEYHGINEATIYGYYNSHKDRFSKEKRDEIERLKNLFESEKYNKYADIIIGFCNEYKQFPSNSGKKEYQGKNENTIYQYYRRYKDNFSKPKQEEIKGLKKLYSNKRGIQTLSQAEIDNYANIIIGFCNEYKKFPSQSGTKEYQGISEKTIYGYYNSHKDKFSKEKLEEIERLKDLYPNNGGRKKIVQVENEIDNTKGKGR